MTKELKDFSKQPIEDLQFDDEYLNSKLLEQCESIVTKYKKAIEAGTNPEEQEKVECKQMKASGDGNIIIKSKKKKGVWVEPSAVSATTKSKIKKLTPEETAMEQMLSEVKDGVLVQNKRAIS